MTLVERAGLWSEDRKAATREAERRMKAGEMSVVRLAFADQHGILRGKTLTAGEVDTALKNGVGFTTMARTPIWGRRRASADGVRSARVAIPMRTSVSGSLASFTPSSTFFGTPVPLTRRSASIAQPFGSFSSHAFFAGMWAFSGCLFIPMPL